MREDTELAGNGEWSEEKPAFNIAVLYGTRRGANRAMNLYWMFQRVLGEQLDFHCDLMRFDALKFPEPRKAAREMIAAGDLLVVAARSDHKLPKLVKVFLTESLQKGRPRPGGLVALLETNDKLSEAACDTRQCALDLAERGGMALFLHEANYPDTGATTPGAPGRTQSRQCSRTL